MYNIQDLRTFVAIADFGGISAAARALSLAPATITHRLQKLEDCLAVALFHRNSRSMSLSSEGKVFYEHVVSILQDISNAEAEIGSHGREVRGHLRVTTAPWILKRFILPNLCGLQRLHPHLTYEFLAVDRFVNLVGEQQDCAIRVGKLNDSSMVTRKLANNRRILCASTDYLNKYGMPNKPEDLSKHHGIFLPWQQDWGFGHSPSKKLVLSNSDCITDAASCGLGIALKSQLAVSRELKNGTLHEVLPGHLVDADAPISSLRPMNQKDSRKVDKFVEFAISTFRRMN